MSQCMHDGRSGPCERLAAPAEFYCKRHMPKAKKARRWSVYDRGANGRALPLGTDPK